MLSLLFDVKGPKSIGSVLNYRLVASIELPSLPILLIWIIKYSGRVSKCSLFLIIGYLHNEQTLSLWMGCLRNYIMSSATVNGHYSYFLNRFTKLFLLFFTGEENRCYASSFYTYLTFLFFLGKFNFKKLRWAGKDCSL